MPWAYTCYGYQYLPKRHGGTAQVMVNPTEAEVVRSIYRAAVEEGLSCRQITKRLNQSQTATPSGKNRVWQPSVVGYILTNRVYAGTARFNYRQSVIPKHRKTDDESKLQSLKTGRSYRPESEWILSEAPAIISAEIFEKAQLELARHREAADRIYRPSSHRYLLRTLVKCGECGLAMFAKRQHSKDKKYEYLYYECVGHHPLTVGRTTKCRSKNVRADRLDQVVWQALAQLLTKPEAIPQLHSIGQKPNNRASHRLTDSDRNCSSAGNGSNVRIGDCPMPIRSRSSASANCKRGDKSSRPNCSRSIWRFDNWRTYAIRLFIGNRSLKMPKHSIASWVIISNSSRLKSARLFRNV